MEINTSTLKVSKTAHISVCGIPSKNTKYVWIVAHGYGQTCERIIRKFSDLDPHTHIVVVPEALSSFYWKGAFEGPGASWMTSRHRLDEIEDYCNYLDIVYEKYKLSGAKVILFGFSQGSTTLYRWINARKPTFDYFINWAGWVPEDVNLSHLSEVLSENHFIILGDKDEYLTKKRVDKMKEVLKNNHLSYQLKEYSGIHRIDRNILKNFIADNLD